MKAGAELPEETLKKFVRKGGGGIEAVVHRIVHGGSKLTGTCIIDDEVKAEIERLSTLAPLHNPVALKWIAACRTAVGAFIPQVAVFDTAFYASMPEVSKIYAMSQALCRAHGIRRYGFHGIAHRAMLERYEELSPDAAKERIISIQLGSGCSITAIKNGLPVDTSMGFSPNEGLVMSTRSGDIDSGVLLYLAENAGLTIKEIDRMLNRSSGLIGLSGLSDDMKTILSSDSPDSELAVELYCYRVKKYIGAYMAALGGVDAILFGGGVGENSPVIREKILHDMEWCGLALDHNTNESTVGKEARISSGDSSIDVIVIPVDEGSVMAKEALNLL
jgi:acetate kinase